MFGALLKVHTHTHIYSPNIEINLFIYLFSHSTHIKGGGISGQAGAVRLGISRAMEVYEPTLRPQLREDGMLTRDRRRVERKKPGQKKARKKFQWVKR